MIILILLTILTVLTINYYDHRHFNTGKPRIKRIDKKDNNSPKINHTHIIVNDYKIGQYYI